MRFFDSATIPASDWIWLAIALLMVTFALLVWTYWRAHKFFAGNKKAFILKLLGVIILALLLTEPILSGRQAKSGANLFVVIADNSSGMNVLDHGMTASRAEILQEALDSDRAEWLGTIANDFQLRQYIFDSRLRRTTDFSELDFEGKATSIITTLRTIAERYKNRPLAGALLLSDGNATDITDGRSYDLSDMPPVYPVVIGGSRPQKDISLENVSVSQTSFEDSPVTIQTDVDTTGFAGKTVDIDLIDNSGELIERQTQRIGRDQQKQFFSFRLRPEQTGILFYDLEVTEKLDADSSNESEAPSEATMVNNKRTLVVDRGGGPFRILYVTGRPNWEYKYLRRAISEDEQVHLVALVRVARREPKFNWLGHAGETTNPLYRGFNNADEQSEQYDQPVLVRLNTEDEKELQDGFPANKEELFEYHAIIFDDVEAEFFTPVQMNLVRQFVAERGGGFLMLGGKESFQGSGFEKTAIGQIVPVHLDMLPERPTAGKMFLDLTREGLLQPWARLRDNQIDEQQRLSDMPEFRVLNRLQSVKAGASVIASISNDWAQEFPALVVQRYGNGRAAALTIGDIWRWGMRESQMHEDMDKFWRQTLRWLVADVPEQISIQSAYKPDQLNQPVTFQVRVRDKGFEPADNVSVVIEVQDPQEQTTRLAAEPVLDETGLFEATYIPRLNGGYLAKAIVTDMEGTEMGSSQTGWATHLDALEFKSIRVNRPLLEQIAQQTGGRIVELDRLDDFARSLPHQSAPVTETWVSPLWDSPGISLIIFLFILMCFIGEWALRRWRGMP